LRVKSGRKHFHHPINLLRFTREHELAQKQSNGSIKVFSSKVQLTQERIGKRLRPFVVFRDEFSNLLLRQGLGFKHETSYRVRRVFHQLLLNHKLHPLLRLGVEQCDGSIDHFLVCSTKLAHTVREQRRLFIGKQALDVAIHCRGHNRHAGRSRHVGVGRKSGYSSSKLHIATGHRHVSHRQAFGRSRLQQRWSLGKSIRHQLHSPVLRRKMSGVKSRASRNRRVFKHRQTKGKARDVSRSGRQMKLCSSLLCSNQLWSQRMKNHGSCRSAPPTSNMNGQSSLHPNFQQKKGGKKHRKRNLIIASSSTCPCIQQNSDCCCVSSGSSTMQSSCPTAAFLLFKKETQDSFSTFRGLPKTAEDSATRETSCSLRVRQRRPCAAACHSHRRLEEVHTAEATV